MEEKKYRSLIIVVSAPSGSGKTTIVDRLLDGMTGIKRSVSVTTRTPRINEKNGVDYIFVSKEEFERKIIENKFIEWEKIFENYYGTAEEDISRTLEDGTDVILSIDVKGAKNIKKMFPESISIFVMPPSLKELESRLRNRRTEDENKISMRINEAKKEMESADEYDYLIVNENLDEAVSELRMIIEQERKNRK